MSTNQSSDQDQSQSAGRGGSESEYMPLQNSKIDSFSTVYGVCVINDNVYGVSVYGGIWWYMVYLYMVIYGVSVYGDIWCICIWCICIWCICVW